MDKKRLKVTLAVLNAVKGKFREIKNFIDDNRRRMPKGKYICR